jgi:hypothetical protein
MRAVVFLDESGDDPFEAGVAAGESKQRVVRVGKDEEEAQGGE